MRGPRRGRGVSPVIATIFLVAITVVAGIALWTFRPTLPSQPVTLTYLARDGGGEPTWGDGSDCKNVMDPTTHQTTQTCLVLPTIDVILTGASLSYLPLSELTFIFECNGTQYLTAPLTTMEWVPGTAATVGGNAPQLGHCGSYVPPAAAWNRLAFFEQVTAGDAAWEAGDHIVLYAHTFEPPNCPSPGPNGKCDDDFHGAPEWCYTVTGACSLLLVYNGQPPGLALRLSLYGLST